MPDGLQTQRIDFLLKPEPDNVDEPWLLRTSALSTERTRFAHLIPDQQNESFFDLMDNFKVDISLLSIFLGSLLATLLIGFCIRRLAYRVRFGASRRPKLIRGLQVHRFAYRKLGFMKIELPNLPALAILALFFGEFIWLTELFLINNIKTNKVVNIGLLKLFD